jgi:hypothetical protein
MVVDFDEQRSMTMLEEFGQLGVDIASIQRPWRDGWRRRSSGRGGQRDGHRSRMVKDGAHKGKGASCAKRRGLGVGDH